MKNHGSETALILIDIQNDFCPGGALEVADGDQIVPLVNKLQSIFSINILTQDWHPNNHKSFASNHEKTSPSYNLISNATVSSNTQIDCLVT